MNKQDTPRIAAQTWFRQARWGVCTHYLGQPDLSADDWNVRIDAFDVNGLATQLAEVGASYFLLTIGQNSGHYCAPNPVYDELTGVYPSKLSRRDLVLDLAVALAASGIKLFVYLPAGAPDQDLQAVEALDWQRGPHRNAAFQAKWEHVISEWSERWGDSVTGWWFDGCFLPDAMYRFEDAPNFVSFAAAARAGNPASLIAFNPGIRHTVAPISSHEDYTAGEVDAQFPVPLDWPNGLLTDAAVAKRAGFPPREEDQYVLHILSFLGMWWGQLPTRFPDEFVVGYTKIVNERGGVITWDVPLAPNGHLPASIYRQLHTLGHGLEPRPQDTKR